MRYAFLVETYTTERIKVVSVWSEFGDQDLVVRPRSGDPRGRSVLEQMVHQCVSEDLWFRNMLGIDVGAPPLPKQETRTDFIERYVEDSGKRLAALRTKDERWWEEEVKFFEVGRSRAWVMVRRVAHTSSSRTDDGYASHAGPGDSQQLWPHGGYRRVDGQSRADDLCLRKLGGVVEGGACGEVAGR